MPRICPRPLSASSAPSFSYPVAYHYPVSTLTRGIQGCPKTISLDKNIWHSTFWKSFQTSFFLPLCVRTFLQHLLPKNALLFPPLNNPGIFSGFFFHHSFFHPCLTNANYLCRRIFGTSLFNPSRRASGFTREGGRGGGKQITSTLPYFYCPLSPNS